MKQKLFLTSAIAMGFVAPAMAEPFPSNGLMQENTTYTNAATAANMDSVYEGTVNATAQYETLNYLLNAGMYLPADSEIPTTCPVGSYCSGIGNVQYDEHDAQGIETCPTNYTSEAGASAQNQCYQTCSASCTQPTAPAHSKDVTYGTETASGRTYYGSSCDAVAPTCSISFDCVNGYHKVGGGILYPLSDLASVAGVNMSVAQQLFPGKTTVTEAEIKAVLTPQLVSMFINNYENILSNKGITHDQYIQTQVINILTMMANARAGMESIGISGNKLTETGIDYGYSRLDGSEGSQETNFGLTQGSGEWETDFSYGIIKGQALCATNRTTGYNEIGTPEGTDGQYCWCKMTGYTPNASSTMQNLSSSWVFNYWFDDADACSYECAYICAIDLRENDYFRGAMFVALGVTATAAPAVCEANTITINWTDVDEATAGQNNEGTATYGGDVRTPFKAATKKGQTFKGWKFSKPTTTQLPN